MQTLEFNNPVFFEGVNVTVRKGEKWRNIFDDGYKDVTIKATNGETLGTGRLKAVEYCKFTDIKIGWLAMEHDDSCYTIEGLKAAMLKAYPDFKDDDFVSVVFFTVNLNK